jgi:cell volume regulation protein A
VPTLEHLLLGAAILLLAGVLASKASDWLGVPALLVFLAVGMVAGSDGPGGIPFDDPHMAQTIGVVALVFILFSGGLDTNWSSTRTVLWAGLSLSTVGVLVTALTVGWFASLVLGVPLLEGFLLGSIVSSTDAAAVFSILRTRGAGLEGKTQPLLEFESGSNDPMAVFLTVGFIQLIQQPTASPADLVAKFLLQMTLGFALGFGVGKLGLFLINRLALKAEGLYTVLTLSLALLTYSMANIAGGNGFLAVYVAGIVLGYDDFLHRRSLIRFHDGLAWLMQIGMFLTLGLLVFPSRLQPVAGVALLISFFLIFVGRPFSVFSSLALSKLGVRTKVLISWVGLRGAVPIILATFPLVAGTTNADLYFNVVFFIVLTSVLLQGTTLTAVAKGLGLQTPAVERARDPLEFLDTPRSKNNLIELNLRKDSPAVGKRVVDLDLPKSALLVLIRRGDEVLVPRGATALEDRDVVVVIAEKEDIVALRATVLGIDHRKTSSAQ